MLLPGVECKVYSLQLASWFSKLALAAAFASYVVADVGLGTKRFVRTSSIARDAILRILRPSLEVKKVNSPSSLWPLPEGR